MIDLSFFNSAKMAVVFILMLSSTTLEAQQNENDKFYDLIKAIGEHFGGAFNDAEKALELTLNGTNAFLEGLQRFATRVIVRKDENGEFECISSKEVSKKPAFKAAIKAIFGENVRNLLKTFIVPKQSESVKLSGDQLYKIKTIFGEKSDKKAQDLLNGLSVKFSDKQLLNLLFSFATRLEALVHGKNSDGTLKEKQENSKDKIQLFLAVPKCFPEKELSIFNYWIEIIEMKTKNSQKPIYGVAIYKEKYDEFKNEFMKERAFELSRENYEILQQLNDQNFSIYETKNLLRDIFNMGYSPRRIPSRKMPEIFNNLLNQISSVFYFNREWDNKPNTCEYGMIFQNISESLMKMMSDKMIDPKLHLDSQDLKIQECVQKDVLESSKKFDNDNEEVKIIFLKSVHYELAINFEFNQRKDVYDRAEDLLSDWVDDWALPYHDILQLPEELYLKRNAFYLLHKIKHFTSNTNREAISIIEALIGKEHIHQFNLLSLFDEMKWLVKKTILEEEAKLWRAKEEINMRQLESDINYLKNNPKSIGEKKYQTVVGIICTIKQHGKKIEMLKPEITDYQNSENQNKLNYSLLQIQQYREHFGPELWEQTKESCNHLKFKQIKMEEEKPVLAETLSDLYFEIDEIWKNFCWNGIEEIVKYYLSIPLMQLKEQARSLAKTFGKMLENVKEHYANK
ncbi:hypothetical protein GPALN_004195 [Globodera pallida]|nr:hypothetical protein GPALN_004195 [Globodera pallida]